MDNQNSISRRKFLKGVTAAGVAALAGCNEGNSSKGFEPTNPEETPEYLKESFQYFFQNEPGFNQVGEEIPENAEDWQIVHSALENHENIDNWEQMQLNDHHMARLDIREGIEPHAEEGHEGSVEQIIQKTQENLEKWPENPENEDIINGVQTRELQKDDHQAVKYTLALRTAVQEVTNQSDSAAADFLNTNLAEYTLEQLDIDIPDYKLTTLMTTKHAPEYACENMGCEGGPREDPVNDRVYLNSGFAHPIGFLQYKEDGEQQTRYIELENMTYSRVNKPENSIYRSSLDKDTVEDNGTWFPEHYVSGFDYEKGRELEEQGILDKGRTGGVMLWGILSLVDDAEERYDYADKYETGGAWSMPRSGIKEVVSDSFGESLSEYVVNPTNQKRRYLEGTSRAIFSALDKHGFGEPIALDGTIEDPEILHTTEDQRNQIIEDQAYDEVRQRVLG